MGLCHQSPKFLSQTEGLNMLSEGKTLGPAESFTIVNDMHMRST